jgi:hypothetical protein
MQFNNSASTKMKIKNMTTLHLKKSIGRSPLRRGLFLIPLVLACFALLPSVQATPDPSPRPGTGNVADGNGALAHVTAAASFDSAFGNNALNTLTTGNNNAAQGNSALFTSNGDKNTAVGVTALRFNAAGDDNTAVGYKALNASLGSSNTAVGSAAGVNATGQFGTFLGANAGFNVTAADNVIAIGSLGANVPNSCYIGNIFGAHISSGSATTVGIDATGKLGTTVSSRRFKKDIKPMDQASEAILRLKPVTFHYKSDTSGFPQFGLVAEDVAEVSPDLIVRDADGQIFSVRYEAVNAMLLNEFLKEHRKVQEQEAAITQVKSNAAKQEATIALQQQEIKALAANLKDQAAQIQKVSAELKVSKPAPRTVVDNH